MSVLAWEDFPARMRYSIMAIYEMRTVSAGVRVGGQHQIHCLPVLGPTWNWSVWRNSWWILSFRPLAVVFSRGSLEMLRLLEGHEYGGQVGFWKCFSCKPWTSWGSTFKLLFNLYWLLNFPSAWQSLSKEPYFRQVKIVHWGFWQSCFLDASMMPAALTTSNFEDGDGRTPLNCTGWHLCRSWDAVKGSALDQTTDHADYVQVKYTWYI